MIEKSSSPNLTANEAATRSADCGVIQGAGKGKRPQPRILISQLQMAVHRSSMRDDRSFSPLTVVFDLEEEVKNLQAGIETSNRRLIEQSLVNLQVASVWIADRYSVNLQKGYQALGYGVALEDIVEKRTRAFEGLHPSTRLQPVRSRLQEITRNVGLYELGYREGEAQQVPPLLEAIPEFHVSLLDVAIAFQLTLSDKFASALRLKSIQQASQAEPNPPYSPAVHQFRKIANRTYCPFAATARMWGATAYDPSVTPHENIRRSIDSLIRFTRVARRELLDAFVYAFPAERFGHDLGHLASLLRTLIGTLMANDPLDPRDFRSSEVTAREWRFRFCGEDYFVPVFAPIFPQNHSRYTYEISDTVFVLLQPNTSFHSRLEDNQQAVREQIRRRFSEGFQSYQTTREIEAHRFLPPLDVDAPPPAWYHTAELR